MVPRKIEIVRHQAKGADTIVVQVIQSNGNKSSRFIFPEQNGRSLSAGRFLGRLFHELTSGKVIIEDELSHPDS